jgi:GTP-binding protein
MNQFGANVSQISITAEENIASELLCQFLFLLKMLMLKYLLVMNVPVLFISALTKQRVFKAVETAMQVYRNRQQKIPTAKLNEVMLAAIDNYPPPTVKGKYIRIKYVTQLPTPSPQFAFFCNLPQYIRDPYRRYLENKMRENFELQGVPVQIYFREK